MADNEHVSSSTWAIIHIMKLFDFSCWLFENAENWNAPTGSDAYRRVCQQYHSSKEAILDIVERFDPGLDSLADFWSETDFLQFPQDISECYIMLGKMCALYTLRRLDFESLRFHVHRKPLLDHIWAIQSAQIRARNARLARQALQAELPRLIELAQQADQFQLVEVLERGIVNDNEGLENTMDEVIGINDDFIDPDGNGNLLSASDQGFHSLGQLMCMFYMYIMPTDAERRRDYVALEQYM
jgi:hypothetical protein